jgi:hypothetical protein
MVFAPPGTKVLEFLPLRQLERDGENPRPCFRAMAYALDHVYWIVEPVATSERRHFFSAPDMHVEVDQVLTALRHMGVAV